MATLRNKNTKYICLIAVILILLSDYSAGAIQCVQCGGSEAACTIDLKESPTNCPADTETVIYTKCFTQIDTSGKIQRGCKTDDEAKTCTADNNCVITEAAKNNQLICKKCEGSDEKCSQTDMNVNDLKYNQICPEASKKCLTKVDNKLVVRGCASDSDVTQCTDANICKTCETVNCNTGIFPTNRINCYQCSGSSCTDVAANSAATKPCLNYVDKDECYTVAKSETDMVRGCKSDTTDNQCSSNGEGCAFCTSNNCNNLKYKYDQTLKCHQCTSDDTTSDCFKQQTSQDFKSCEKQLLYNETQYCYTNLNDETIQRGCFHDNAGLTLDQCKDGDSDVCNKCNDTNGCNSKAVTVVFTCIVCRSDLEPKCYDEADKLQGDKCRTSPSSSKDGCFHGIWNGVVIRGCMVDAAIQNQEICKDKDDLQCNVCYKKNCNTEKSGAGKIGLQFVLLLLVLTTLWNFK